jgi:hypothetical protein
VNGCPDPGWGTPAGCVPGTLGTTSQDPVFVDPSGGDYSLQVTSPSLDAGIPPATASYADDTPLPAEDDYNRDRLRKLRPTGGPDADVPTYDLGAFEVQ